MCIRDRSDVWSFAGDSEIGIDDRDVTAYLNATANEAGFQSSEDYMEASNAILVVEAKLYPRWDINEDGVVDYKDLGILIAHYGEETNPPYPRWDINEDGVVDYKDLGILIAHYGEMYE